MHIVMLTPILAVAKATATQGKDMKSEKCVEFKLNRRDWNPGEVSVVVRKRNHFINSRLS